MKTTPLYTALFNELKEKLILPVDLPDETVESTLNALWLTAAGHPCSAKKATISSLPELTNDAETKLRELTTKRLEGTPLMHLTGFSHFMGLELAFNPNVCFIRPETEILGNCAVSFLQNLDAPIMIDVGCGSGNLTCGVAAAINTLRVYAVDILTSSVSLTRKNIDLCKLSNSISVFEGDAFEPLRSLDLEGKVDAVICNPPYIASSRIKGDRAHLLAHEPVEALDGGPFGFKMHQRLIREAPFFLRDKGVLMSEFGAGQHQQVQKLFERSGLYESVEFGHDDNGQPRVIFAIKKGVSTFENRE